MSIFLQPANGKGLKIPVDKAIVFIGRHPECDVVITRSRMISRKHCAIVQINDFFVIRDLGSTNGVRINRKKVEKEGRFNVGDTISIGDLDYVVTQVKAAEPERRPNRDHPQDARAAGAIPLPRGLAADVSPPPETRPIVSAATNGNPESQEIPVAISEDEPFDADEGESDTSDSIPAVSDAPFDEAKGSEAGVPEQRRRFADSDSQIPLPD